MLQKFKKMFQILTLDPKLSHVYLSWAIHHPRYLKTIIRFTRSYQQATLLREAEKLNGLQVPPFLILSITSRCNLRCVGCYAIATGTISNYRMPEHPIIQLSKEKWRKIITDASNLGVFGFIIAGGEPFLFPGLLDLCKEFKDRLFLIFTNGTALNENIFKCLRQISNTAVIVSIEGSPEMTDSRRGVGVYKKGSYSLYRLSKLGNFTGISVTITRSNFKYWMNQKSLDHFINQGIRLAVFIEHIPITPNEQYLMLTPEERLKFRSFVLHYRAAKPIYIIHSPGDEEYFGGCVSAGRGFAHITPAGDLTPCPVSNIATHNLLKTTLREGLASALFKEIRENEHLLETNGIPCALFTHPQEVKALAKATGAYRTDTREAV